MSKVLYKRKEKKKKVQKEIKGGKKTIDSHFSLTSKVTL